MPIYKGRWESWAARTERLAEAAEQVVTPTVEATDDVVVAPAPKVRRKRRGRAAAQAAIAEATGAEVDLSATIKDEVIE